MIRLLIILSILSQCFAQSQIEQWRLQKDKEIQTENTVFAVGAYASTIAYSFCDASVDAITWSNGNNYRGLKFDSWHDYKHGAKASMVLAGGFISVRAVFDYTRPMTFPQSLFRASKRTLALAALGTTVWDLTYLLSRYGRIPLEPNLYSKPTGIDGIDELIKPTNRYQVVSIYAIKLGITALLIYWDEI